MADESHTSQSDTKTVNLCRGEAFFEGLLNSIGDVATVLDSQGHITYHSAGLKKMLGVEPSEAIGIHAADIVHRDDHDYIAERIDYCLKTPKAALTERFRLGHIDGSWKWVEAKILNLLDDVKVRGILVVSTDITDKVRLEEQLAMAEKTTAFGLFRWDATTLVTTLSEASASMLSLGEGNTVVDARDLFSVVHPKDVALVRNLFQEVVLTGAPFIKTLRVLRSEGCYRHFAAHGFPEFDDDGNVIAVAGVIDDVTDDIKTQQALSDTEAQYRLIAEHAHDIFARHSLDGKLTFLSPAAKSVLGIEPESVIGQNIIQFMHEDDQPIARELIKTLGVTTDSVRLVFRIRHSDGHYIWAEATVQVIYDEITGEITEAIAITRDISETKEYEQKLLDAREHAETANRSKSTFLANMSHELRTPLNAIIGFSEILKREMFGPLGDENYNDYAGLIFDSGTHLLDLINDILDMSKIEAGKMEISLEPIDVADIAQSCLRLIEPKSKEKSQKLQLNNMLNDDEPFVLGDLRATKQIILNLLSNAVKFTGKDGTICVDLHSHDDGVEITVRDDGVGIAQEDIARLMKPFEQVVGQSTIAEEGSGLGLALTNSFCELQGGTFSLESTLGDGTRAIVTLPKAHAERHASAKAV